MLYNSFVDLSNVKFQVRKNTTRVFHVEREDDSRSKSVGQ